MVRNRKRKTEIGLTDRNVMMEGVKCVLGGGLSVKQAAIRFQIPRTTLIRYINKCKEKDINWEQATIDEIPKMAPNYTVRQVFQTNEEEMLADYLIDCARLHHGLPPIAARKLAYDFAKANNKNMPQSWEINQLAGKDWFLLFMKRNQHLSL